MRLATQALVLIQLTRLLGPHGFGDFTAAASLALVLGMLPTLGAGFVMLARHAHDPSGISDVWRYAWPLTLLLGLVLLGIYVLLGGLITSPPLPTRVLLAIGASELLLIPLTYLASYSLQAADMVPRSQFVQWLPLGFRTLAALPCFLAIESERLILYASLQLATSFLGTLLALGIASRCSSLDWRPRRPSIRELYDGSIYAAMNLVATNPSEVDKIMAVRAIGAHDTGIYATTFRVMASATTPVIGMLLSAQPRLFKYAHTRATDGRNLIKTLLLLSGGWGLLSGLLLYTFRFILPALFGAPYEAAAQLMPWIAISAPLLSLRLCAGSVLVAFGRPMDRLFFELFGICILVLGILFFAPHYRMHGLAMALALAESSMAAIGWLTINYRICASEL